MNRAGKVFLLGAALNGMSPAVLTTLAPGLQWTQPLADVFNLIPDVRALSEASEIPLIASLSYGFSLASAYTVAFVSMFIGLDLAAAKRVASELRPSTRFLYSAFALILLLAPFFLSVSSRSHQFSYSFFVAVQTSVWGLTLWALGVYLYTVGFIVAFFVFAKGE